MCNLPNRFVSVYVYVRFAISSSNLKILSISINIHKYQVEIKFKCSWDRYREFWFKKWIHGKLFNYKEYILPSLNITELKYRFIFTSMGSQGIWNQILSLWLTSCMVIKLISHALFFQMSAGLQSTTDNLHVPEAEKLFLKPPDCLSWVHNIKVHHLQNHVRRCTGNTCIYSCEDI